MPRALRRLLAAAVFVLSPWAARADAEWSLRLAFGVAASRDTVLRDGNCLATTPPALFGCGAGSDGRGLAARGDFGRGTVGELAVGARLRRDLRLEVAVLALRGLALDAQSNFVRVAGAQPVGAGLDSDALLAVATWEPAATFGWHLGRGRLGRLEPFLSAGVGGARHRLEPVTFRFPGIAANAVTVTRGGRERAGAWLLGVGAGMQLSAHATLELSARRVDLGSAATAAGPATIVRPTRTFTLALAPTRARVRVDTLSLGLRWSW